MELEIWHLWMLLTIGLFVVEIIISSFTSICFGMGALVAGVLAYIGVNLSFQLLVFISISILTLMIVKPYLQKYMVSKTALKVKSSFALVGKEAYVLEEINPAKHLGRIIVAGSGRKATSKYGEIIPEGSFVKIVGSNNLILTVKEI